MDLKTDFKKVSNVGGGLSHEVPKNPKAPLGGPNFADILGDITKPTGLAGSVGSAVSAGVGPLAAGTSDGVKFSNHAVDRMVSRGIKFSPEDVGRLNEAVTKAAAKGSKDTLVLMNNSALIVSVKNKTVVTVMDQQALKENVFTNIDSTIVM